MPWRCEQVWLREGLGLFESGATNRTAFLYTAQRMVALCSPSFGWHYLSNATCQIRPHLFYTLFVVSRITIICNMISHF